MDGLYSYLTESEREELVEEAVMTEEINSIITEFTICNLQHDINIRNIDAAALYNNYNESTLTELYIKEAEANNAKKMGLWERFKKFLKSIGDKIRKLFGAKVDGRDTSHDDEEIDIDAALYARAQALADNRSGIKSLFSFKDKNGNLDKKKVGVIGAALALGGIFIGKKFINKDKVNTNHSGTVKVRRGKLWQIIDVLRGVNNDIEKGANSVNAQNENGETLQDMAEVGSTLSNECNSTTAKLISIGSEMRDLRKQQDKETEAKLQANRDFNNKANWLRNQMAEQEKLISRAKDAIAKNERKIGKKASRGNTNALAEAESLRQRNSKLQKDIEKARKQLEKLKDEYEKL